LLRHNIQDAGKQSVLTDKKEERKRERAVRDASNPTKMPPLLEKAMKASKAKGKSHADL